MSSPSTVNPNQYGKLLSRRDFTAHPDTNSNSQQKSKEAVKMGSHFRNKQSSISDALYACLLLRPTNGLAAEVPSPPCGHAWG